MCDEVCEWIDGLYAEEAGMQGGVTAVPEMTEGARLAYLGEFKSKLRRRSFTWFNYVETDVETLRALPAEKVDYVCWGFEVTKAGRKHLQGYVEVKTPLSGEATIARIAGGRKRCPGLSVFKLRKDNRDVNINYCRKEDSTDVEAVERWGSKFIEVSHKAKTPGKRTDWHDLHDMCVDGKTFSEVAEVFPEHAIKYHGGIDRLMRAAEEARQMGEFVSSMSDVVLRPWQAKMAKKLSGRVNDRRVYWVYDTVGNQGKSWFAKYLVARMGAARFPNGCTRDIALAYKGEGIVAFDFTRSVEGKLNYGLMESMKDGEIFSSKYESRVKRFGSPHIVCLANWMPDMSRMSADRWSIIDLSQAKWHKGDDWPATEEVRVEETPEQEALRLASDPAWMVNDAELTLLLSETPIIHELDSVDVKGIAQSMRRVDEETIVVGRQDEVSDLQPRLTPEPLASERTPELTLEDNRLLHPPGGAMAVVPPSAPGGMLPRNNIPCGDCAAALRATTNDTITEDDLEWLMNLVDCKCQEHM